MVGKRRNLLRYLKNSDIERYRTLIKKTTNKRIIGAVIPLFLIRRRK